MKLQFLKCKREGISARKYFVCPRIFFEYTRCKMSTSIPIPTEFIERNPEDSSIKSIYLGALNAIISAALLTSIGIFAVAAKSLPVPKGISPREHLSKFLIGDKVAHPAADYVKRIRTGFGKRY